MLHAVRGGLNFDFQTCIERCLSAIVTSIIVAVYFKSRNLALIQLSYICFGNTCLGICFMVGFVNFVNMCVLHCFGVNSQVKRVNKALSALADVKELPGSHPQERH